MKLGSLFSGSGGFELGGLISGITPVWASEIEPFPIRVTSKRFPNIKHLGDISKVKGDEIEPVDVITFGSPCQDLSVAGKRAGLKHESIGDEETTRSGLFMEAVRIIKEMRCKTDGKYPTFAVWENVPGAYSSNKGEDFRAVLEELCKIKEESVSIPKPAKWLYAGEILGDGYSIAWRTLDAQYWGVPQRRRRIYLVADFRGQRASKVLFEREGLRGDFKTCGEKGQGVTADVEGSVGTTDSKREPVKLLEMTHADEVIRECKGDKCPTLQARMGTGGNQVPLVMEQTGINGDIAATLDASYYKGCGMRQGIEREVVIAIDRAAYNQGINAQYDIGVDDSGRAHTLVARGPNAVCYGIGNGQVDQLGLNHERVGCLNCMHDQQAVLIDREPQYIVRRLTPTECCRLQGFPDGWCSGLETPEPTEEDLIFWREVFETHRKIVTGASKPKSDKQIIKWLKDPHSDSAEYKLWGNGVALLNTAYVLQGIADELRGEGYV